MEIVILRKTFRKNCWNENKREMENDRKIIVYSSTRAMNIDGNSIERITLKRNESLDISIKKKIVSTDECGNIFNEVIHVERKREENIYFPSYIK